MPQIAAITVNDREATPVARTYNPAGTDKNGVPVWKTGDVGVPFGEAKLTMSTRQQGSKHKVRINLVVPTIVTETINGVDRNKLERSAYCAFEFTFADDSTKQERDNAIGMFANLLASSQTVPDGALVEAEGLW